MRHLWMRFPIKFSMVVLFMGISLISLMLMGMISHIAYSNAVKQDFHTVTDEASKRLNHHIEFYFEQLSKTTRTLMNAEPIQSWFDGSREVTIFEKEEIEAQLRRHVALNFTEVAGIFLLSTDRRVLAMRSYLSEEVALAAEPWFSMPFSEERALIPTHTIAYPQMSGIPVISMLNPVYSNRSLAPIGSIIIDLSLQELEATFERSRLGETGQFMMLSQDDTIVYHQLKDWRGRKLADTPMGVMDIPEAGGVSIQKYGGKKMLVSTSSSQVSGWKVVAVVPFDEMASGLYAARNMTLLAFLLIAIVIVLAVPRVSNLFITPVLHLKQQMNRVFQGDYETRAEFHQGRNEFQKLNYSFNKMVEQLDEQIRMISNLKLQEMQSRLRQKEAYIQALQNQINPHLLYNSLDVIKSIGYINNDELVVSMAGNLADVYRYTARISDNEVALREELAILEKYLEITHIRFPKKFQSRITVHPKFRSCSIMKLTIQPIVENAVKYAVEPKGGDAAIIVSAYNDRDDLVIEIADNGQGIAEAKLKELNERLDRMTENDSGHSSPSTESMGITNVHARLVLNYGETYGLRLSSFEGRGTVVSIRIPLSLDGRSGRR
ncbi:two-component system, sensor histidine kinase YesM [Paenibacillus sp. UNCCL117]|uniref:cache domain-containing sensor histidine kinase n=1 Tax=unclassified Paenibacillus TaxID=185978 RepID=UPI000887D5F5|nr:MULTISPECIES: sensor histidine kinase [unclassified Paenibacillus]SDE20562.1 two-component system, sensor histidine kinase YesM [Paenibacillus sp. cl123]SFW61687.1 two-component system, sensor histidine kinase YesM [Paenibacillus sp. UNCCL117]